jgi:MSHA biogenesis protein MshM
MYQKYFGLKELPFSLSPNTQYFFAYGHYADALNTLLVALRTGEGFVKVVGEVGTGKTLMCRKLMNTLDDRFQILYIPNPQLSAYGLQVAVAEELGLKITRYVHRLQKTIYEKLIELSQQGKRVVLCIDEAQAMPEETMESLRLMTNLETESFKLLHVVMFGQPELDELLNRRSVRQLKQRITFSYRLRPIDRDGLEAYVMHRLVVAGYNGGMLFDSKALDGLHVASRGIPRLINILANKALMLAYGQGARSVNNAFVQSAIKDTEDAQLRPMRVGWWRRWVASAAVLGTLATVSGYWVINHGQFP